MGNCLGTAKPPPPKPRSGSNRGSAGGSGGQRRPVTKDFGLGERFEPIKFLGVRAALCCMPVLGLGCIAG